MEQKDKRAEEQKGKRVEGLSGGMVNGTKGQKARRTKEHSLVMGCNRRPAGAMGLVAVFTPSAVFETKVSHLAVGVTVNRQSAIASLLLQLY